jgi:hypothetical protein
VWTAYFNSIDAVGTQQLNAVTGLSLDGSSKYSSWEEVKAPGIENFEKARDNLQTPKRLKLGPLLVAAVQASPSRLLQDFQELPTLNPSPGVSLVKRTCTEMCGWERSFRIGIT